MINKLNVNIGARLDRLPDSGWHVKICIITAFALLSCGSNIIGGAVQNILLNEIHWLKPGSALLAMWTTVYTIGQLLGALIGGPVGDKIGRKKSIILYEIIHIIAMLGGAFSPNIYVLYMFRILQGFGQGSLLIVLFAGFTEYVPRRNRGTWSSRTSFLGNWAYPLTNGVALLIASVGVSYSTSWRIQFMIPSIFSIIVCILVFRKFPESPRWLESQGRYEEANKILTNIENEILASTGKELPPVKEIPQKVVQVPYSAIFKGNLLRRTIVGSMLLIGMNVINETLTNWMPSMLKSMGYDTSQSQFMTMMGLFGAPFGMFIASLVIDKISRRTMGTGLLIAMAALAFITGQQTPEMGIILWTFLLNTSIYMYVCYASAVYVPEMWPTSAKMSGTGFSNAMGRVSNIFFPFLVTSTVNQIGANGVYILISVVAVLIGVSLLFLGVETRGESVESISNT